MNNMSLLKLTVWEGTSIVTPFILSLPMKSKTRVMAGALVQAS